ncbi:hypothetical protein PQX77_019739 [Marasmius sp. AFHP31]|nr:hypothetical protein PQX77_019739 [Marasmius sp. AFHP31]
MQWITEINDLAKYGKEVRKQLGSVVPRRLRDSAKSWYYSLPRDHRIELEKDWKLLREEIGGYYMNRKWSENLQKQANRATYRDSGNTRETPSEYYIRKLNLITTAYDLDDSEIISEVMEGAPSNWNTILTTQNYKTVMDFQAAIRYHEETLMNLDRQDRFKYSSYRSDCNDYKKERSKSYTPRTYLVGTRTDLPPPAFPKDDTNVSKCTTPKDKGTRPCRHCGSELHWDKECKYSGRKTARTRLCETTTDNLQAQDEYDDLFEDLLTKEEGFEVALQTTEERQEAVDSSALEGAEAFHTIGGRGRDGEEVRGSASPVGSEVATKVFQSTVATDGTPTPRPSLNHRSRRRLAKEVSKSSKSYMVHSQENSDVLELRKRMDRPPGCSFLGARATETTATINNLEETLPVVVDSGSDITLISLEAVNRLTSKPHIKSGQKINLVQVTGSSSISGFVVLDLYFHTDQGPVKISVDAYVVNGMSTPFILGNDF